MNYILQIGEGNFLRAFAEDYVQQIYDKNKSYKAIITQPRTNTKVINALNAQGCEYDVIIRGRLRSKTIDQRRHINCVERAIDSVSGFNELKSVFSSEDLKLVISNTTEAGIEFNEKDKKENYPNISFPAKLTILLAVRFHTCKAPIVFMPCELIEHNGDALKECIFKYIDLWGMSDNFIKYVTENCHFCNTLVDRIVTGHDDSDSDPCSVNCEPYKSLIIDCDDYAKEVIPFEGVEFSSDLDFYRKRKVRILNGIHTMSFAASYLSGCEIVRDAVNNELISAYINNGAKEVQKTFDIDISDYTRTIIERFNNPYIDHKFLDISLNSVAKFKARCLPSILDYVEKTGEAPKILSFSIAALIAFYKKDCKDDYEIKDNDEVLDFFKKNRTVSEVLSNESFWGQDLTKVKGLSDKVNSYYDSICKNGMEKAVNEVVYE